MFNLVALYVSLSIVNNSNSPFVVIDDALLYMLKTCAQVCDVLYNIVSMQLTDMGSLGTSALSRDPRVLRLPI